MCVQESADPEEGIRDLGAEVAGNWKLPHIGAGAKLQSPSALQEQQALLTRVIYITRYITIFPGYNNVFCTQLPF